MAGFIKELDSTGWDFIGKLVGVRDGIEREREMGSKNIKVREPRR